MQRGHRHGGRAPGHRRRRQDRHGGDDIGAQPSSSRGSSRSRRRTTRSVAIAVTIEDSIGGFGGDRRRADRQGGHGGSSLKADAMASTAETARRRPLPRDHAARLGRHGRRLLRRGPAARPPGRAEAAATGASPRTSEFVERFRREASQRRRPAAPARRRRSTTAASGTAPTTSRWSTSTGRTLKQLIQRGGAAGPDARDRPRRSRSCAPRASPTARRSSTATSSRTTSSSTTRTARRSRTSASPAPARRT